MFSRQPFGVDPYSGASPSESIGGDITGSNCCCATEQDACTPCQAFTWPETLYGTVSNSTCECIPNDTIITYTYSGGLWTGTVVCDNGDTLTFTLCETGCGECEAGTSGPCMHYDCVASGTATMCANDGYDCDPVNLVYVVLVEDIAGVDLCCTGGGGGSTSDQITITITE